MNGNNVRQPACQMSFRHAVLAFAIAVDGTKNQIAGAWLTSLEGIRVRFPGAEEPVSRWQGSLTPVVNYF